MRLLTITVPTDVVDAAAGGELQILVSDYGDEGIELVKADCRPNRGDIWRPIDLLEEYVK